jgi:hypothetical protein
MAKKKEYSFADEAKAVQKRFSRRETDPIEKRDYEDAMNRLMQEQEKVRTQLGLNQDQQGQSQIPIQQGQQQFQYGGNTEDPSIYSGYDLNSVLNYMPKQPQSSYLTPEQFAQRGQSMNRNSQQIIQNTGVAGNTPLNKVNTPQINDAGINRNPNERWMADESDLVANNITNRITPKGIAGEGYQNPAEIAAANNELTVQDPGRGNYNPKQSFWDKNKQYAPYAISGLSNIASNLLSANMAKKNQPRMSAAMATPQEINLEPQAEAMRRRAQVSKNIASRNARNLGLNSSQAMAGMSASGTATDRVLGENLTNLYMQQEVANVGAANQFALNNQRSQNRANMTNVQLEEQGLQDRLRYMSGVYGTIPGVMKDIRMSKADKETRNIMEAYYKSIGGRNYMTVGTLFTNPENGFTYKVKEVDNGVPIKVEKVK